MAAGIKNRIVIIGCNRLQLYAMRQGRLGLGIVVETLGGRGLKILFRALGIQRRLSPLGRGQGDLGPRILEDIVGGGKLLQPETGLSAGVTEFVVRRQHHQYFHDRISSCALSPATLPSACR